MKNEKEINKEFQCPPARSGYKLTLRLHQVRNIFCLTAVEQAVYHELVSICNAKYWQMRFTLKNHVLITALNITEKTLIRSRERLAEVGLIEFESTKDKRAGCYYAFPSCIDGTSTGVSPGVSSGVSTGVSSGIFPDDAAFTPYSINSTLTD